jgi:2,3-bisphosphoglycerate-independent phosphoglycerate mutase
VRGKCRHINIENEEDRDMSDLPHNAPVVLVILDGWGLEPSGPGNAISQAQTPVFDRLWKDYPTTTLKTCGRDVGLPPGQMGNSEVGHLNLGAGFVVFQSITRIDLAIENGEFFRNAILTAAMQRASEGGRTLHLMGLVSDGGVHSHIDHIDPLLRMAETHGVDDVAIHAILDGRDTSPTGGAAYLTRVLEMIEQHGRGRIASIIGRYYAMDRDKRWERTRKAYDLLVFGEGEIAQNPIAAVQRHYDNEITDEFMTPISIREPDAPPTTIDDGDVVIFFNFRADRARQITQALIGPPIDGLDFPDQPQDLMYVSMTEYADYLHTSIAFPAIDVVFPVARIISDAGLRQFHTAETEKYAHVTYFFNGGREEPFPGEDRKMTPSPKVATYDLQPEMSAPGVGQATVDAVESGQYAFVIVNFANCDMVGHTGVIPAAVTATETVDTQLGRIVEATTRQGGTVLITADHGNAEEMLVDHTDKPMTAHTTNPVPFILVAPDATRFRHATLRDGGRLADVAPTVLDLLGIALPAEMTGITLIASDAS